MAGIYGMVGNGPPSLEDLEAMSSAVAHRGPDGGDQYVKRNVGLGCRRLAVLDLERGQQPVSNESGEIWIVHNGEIYNHRSLRLMLEAKGHSFKTNTDAETVVHLYEEFGERCVEKLRGMFAFALWDEGRQQLLLARDRLGEKPLYYLHDGHEFLFASEVKALVAARGEARELDHEAVHHYLSLRFFPAPQTMLRRVRKLAPAHVLVCRNGSVKTSQYWRPSFHDKLQMTDDAFIEALQAKLAETVSATMTSDVPVGAFLSGGLDSSLIVAMMAKAHPNPFSTFSVGAEADEFNELPYARQVSQRFGTHQVETTAKIDVIDQLPEMIWHLDEPSDPVAAGKFIASRLAAGHVKVVLGGDGGDEMFAGFDRYLGVRSLGPYARLPVWLRRATCGNLIKFLPASFGYNSFSQKLRWIDQVSVHRGVPERFAEAVAFFRFNHADKRRLFTPELWDLLEHVDTSDLIARQFAQCAATDPIDQMVCTDYMTRLPEHSLMLTDRLSMAHGLEVRSPLVDHELIELVARFPTGQKIRRGKRKYVARKVAERELPRAIAKRGKRGFRFPLASWFGRELYPFLRRFLITSPFISEGMFREADVVRMLEEHRARRVDHHVRLWMLLNLQVWYELVIEGRDRESVRERMRAYY